MTIYYFKAKVSIKDTPPNPWIINGREVIVSFTDKTWWAFSEQVIDEGENVQQLYINWLRDLKHCCVVEETFSPIEVKSTYTSTDSNVNKTINIRDTKTKIFWIVIAALFIFILVVALRPTPYVDGYVEGFTTPSQSEKRNLGSSTIQKQPSQILNIGEYAQVYIDISSIVPSYMLRNPLGQQTAPVARSIASLTELAYVMSIEDPDKRGLKYAALSVEDNFIPVENGTSVQIVEYVKDDCYRVKIVGGRSNGSEGYLYRQFLR
jgi:hypothetical protein